MLLHYRHHEHGALGIYNALNVTVKNCTFYNNTSDSYYFNQAEQYQGSSGGLSIGYNMNNSNVSLNITITDTDFINNSALPLPKFKVMTSEIVEKRRFTGRGGGASVLVNVHLSHLSCVIANCKFVNNSANNVGGALYFLFAHVFNKQEYKLDSIIFSNNFSPIAGALCFVDVRTEVSNFSVFTTILNCMFTYNKAVDTAGAAGIYSMEGETCFFVIFRDCEFYSNTVLNGYSGAVEATAKPMSSIIKLYPQSCTLLVQICVKTHAPAVRMH